MHRTEDKRMRLEIVKNQLWFTLLILVLGWSGYWIFRNWYPELYPVLYPVIPLFFFLFGFKYIDIFSRKSERGAKTVLKVYLVAKGIKIGLSLLLLLLCFVLDKQGYTEFLITFLIFYLCYLLYETAFFFLSEKKRKMKGI